jgi:hypothetical protein
MSVEKKSLISRRTAAKKAIVTKPEANTVSTTKVKSFKATAMHVSRIRPNAVATGASRVKI